MSRDTILTMANGAGIDLLNVRPADIDFAVLAEHLGKEKRFNGATPDVEYSVAQHLSIGSDAMLAAGHSETEAAYFHIHDCPEAFWKDDPTPKKRAIAKRISERCGVTADSVLSVLKDIDREHERAVHRAAGLRWPLSASVERAVKRFDLIMFVTEWRDLMHGVAHPNWAPYRHIVPLKARIEPLPWAQARAGWLLRARRLLPALQTAHDAPAAGAADGAGRRVMSIQRGGPRRAMVPVPWIMFRALLRPDLDVVTCIARNEL